MSIRFQCLCGKDLVVKDEMAGKRAKCPVCGEPVTIPGGASAATTPCASCNVMLAAHATQCPTCGWNVVKQQRRCVKCDMPVTLQYSGSGFGTGWAYLGSGSLVSILTFMYFFGLSGTLAVACGAASIFGFFVLMSLRFECGQCDHVVEKRLLGGPERADLAKKKFGYTVGSSGFGVLALVFGFVFIFFKAEASGNRDAVPNPLNMFKGDDGKGKQAAEVAAALRGGMAVASEFQSYPVEKRIGILAALADGDPAIRAAVVREAFKTLPVGPGDPAGTAVAVKAKEIVDRKDFKIDDALAREIDRWIPLLASEAARTGWTQWWELIIGKQAIQLGPEMLAQHLGPLVQDEAQQNDSIFNWIRAGHHRLIYQAMRITKHRDKVNPVEHKLSISIKRLSSSESSEVLLSTAEEAPSALLVTEALTVLFTENVGRSAHLAELTKRFPSIKYPDNRTWIMKEIRKTFPDSRKDDVADPLWGLCLLGLKDPEPSTRAAAVRCAIAGRPPAAAPAETFWKTIQEEPDARERAIVERECVAWVNLHILKVDPRSDDAVRKLEGPILTLIKSIGDSNARSNLEEGYQIKLGVCKAAAKRP